MVIQLKEEKEIIYLIDSSAILSGKPFYERLNHMMASPKIEDEFSQGGRDYTILQFLKQKGLHIATPTRESKDIVSDIAQRLGESDRLSAADLELLALAVDIKEQKRKIPIIISDDYAIQNLANSLSISFQTISQKGITKKFKWERRCRGCGIRVEPQITICSICGSSVVNVVKDKKRIKNKKCDQ